MKVLLIWPYHGEIMVDYVPLALAYLKACVDPARHEVTILDTVLEDLPPGSEAFTEAVLREAPDLVGFSVTSDKFANSVVYARQLKARRPELRTMVGGIHVTSYPHEVMEYDCFDYGFVGEAERSFPRLLDAIERAESPAGIPGAMWRTEGSLQVNPADMPPDLDELPLPDYDAMGLMRYLEYGYRFQHSGRNHALIWASRGCPYTCRFCASPDLNGRQMRYHSADYIEGWIRHLHQQFGTRHFNIIDDNFTYEMEPSKVILCRLVELRHELGVSYAFPNGLRMQRVDEEILALMKQAGFTHVVFAPESGSPDVLKKMRKGLKREIIAPKIALAQRAGLRVMTYWVIGYPGETKQTLEETFRTIMESQPNMVALHVFQPLPGTPIFDELVAQGRLERAYLPTSYQAVHDQDFVAEGLTTADLRAFIRRTYLHHYVLRPWNAWSLIRMSGVRVIGRRILQQLAAVVDVFHQPAVDKRKIASLKTGADRPQPAG